MFQVDQHDFNGLQENLSALMQNIKKVWLKTFTQTCTAKGVKVWALMLT